MKTVILDFNRTVYDPEEHRLITDALPSIKEMKNELGLRLILVAKYEASRSNLVAEMGLPEFFEEIYLVEEKTLALFQLIAEKYEITPSECIVIGDIVRNEIALGRKMDFLTIWFKSGKFANILPESNELAPHFIADNWHEIMLIVRLNT